MSRSLVLRGECRADLWAIPRPLSTFSLPVWCLEMLFCQNYASGLLCLLALHWFQPQGGRRMRSRSVFPQSRRGGCGLAEGPERQHYKPGSAPHTALPEQVPSPLVCLPRLQAQQLNDFQVLPYDL